MWICSSDAFLSVVADRDNQDRMLVRARVKGHIENVFPLATVFTMDEADYLYRAVIDRQEVQRVVAEQIQAIDYPNFKSSVKDQSLHDAYLEIWRVMYALQK
jgi:hypothetical protein